MRVHHCVRSLANEKLSVALDDVGGEAVGGDGNSFAKVGELLLQVLFSRDTEFIYGTAAALRRAWRADERAEFHEGLVEMGAGRGVMRDP